VTIPASIDATGATDVTAALQAWIDGVPDGSILAFGGAGKTYKISRRLNLAGRNHLLLEGGGCTLNNVANGNADGLGGSYYYAFFFNYWGDAAPSHITIRNFVATAANPAPGTFQVGEHACFLYQMQGSYIELDNITVSGLFGAFMALNNHPTYVWAHDNHILNCGANGVALMASDHVLVENNTWGPIGYCCVDLEPTSGTTEGNTNIVFRNNAYSTWDNCFLAINSGNRNTVCTDLEFSNNTVSGSSLLTLATYATANRIKRLAFTGNRSSVTASAPVIRFAHIDGLTVGSNVQPVSSGNMYSISDCTAVVGP